MKTIKPLLLITALFFSLVSFNACSLVSGKNGEVVHKEMNDIPFDKISVGSFIEVIFRQSDTYKVNVMVPRRLEPHLVSKVEAGQLKVYVDISELSVGRHSFDEHPVIEICAPSVEEINLEGASKMTLDGNCKFEKLSFRISGASEFRCERLQAGSLSIYQAGASSMKAGLAVENLDIVTEGTCKMVLDSFESQPGTTLRLDVSGASKLDLSDLPFENVVLNVAGASKIKVYPLKRFDADVSGASKVMYRDSSAELQKEIHKAMTSVVKVL